MGSRFPDRPDVSHTGSAPVGFGNQNDEADAFPPPPPPIFPPRTSSIPQCTNCERNGNACDGVLPVCGPCRNIMPELRAECVVAQKPLSVVTAPDATSSALFVATAPNATSSAASAAATPSAPTTAEPLKTPTSFAHFTHRQVIDEIVRLKDVDYPHQGSRPPNGTWEKILDDLKKNTSQLYALWASQKKANAKASEAQQLAAMYSRRSNATKANATSSAPTSATHDQAIDEITLEKAIDEIVRLKDEDYPHQGRQALKDIWGKILVDFKQNTPEHYAKWTERKQTARIEDPAALRNSYYFRTRTQPAAAKKRTAQEPDGEVPAKKAKIGPHTWKLKVTLKVNPSQLASIVGSTSSNPDAAIAPVVPLSRTPVTDRGNEYIAGLSDIDREIVRLREAELRSYKFISESLKLKGLLDKPEGVASNRYIRLRCAAEVHQLNLSTWLLPELQRAAALTRANLTSDHPPEGDPLEFPSVDYSSLPMLMLIDIANRRELPQSDEMNRVQLTTALHRHDAATTGQLPPSADSLGLAFVPHDVPLAALAIENRRLLESLQADIDSIKLVGQDFTTMTTNQLVHPLSIHMHKLASLNWSQAATFLVGMTHQDLVTLLQFFDAREGTSPSESAKYGSTHWHKMDTKQLRDAARALNAEPAVLACDVNTVRTWLITNHPSAAVPASQPHLTDWQARMLQEAIDKLIQMKIPTTSNALNTAQTRTQRFVAPQDVFDRLETDVAEVNLALDFTSNAGWLCGVRALIDSLNPLISYLWVMSGDPDGEDNDEDDRPARLDYQDVMSLLFEDYIRDNEAEEAPNTQGRPTPAFRDFLHAQLQDFAQEPEILASELRQYTTRNNFNVTQLQFILSFLYDQQFISREFALGVINGGSSTTNMTATAMIVGRNDADIPLVWLHNDNSQNEHAGILGHWTALIPDGGNPNFLPSLGLNPADQEMHGRLRGSMTTAQSESEQSKRDRANKAQQEWRNKKCCLPCREDGKTAMRQCDGVRSKKRCQTCRDKNIPCTWPDAAHTVNPPLMMTGAELYRREQAGEVDVWRRWDKTLSPDEWAEVEKLAMECTLPAPQAGTKYFLVVHSKRLSSQEQDGYLGVHYNALIAHHPRDVQNYRALLASPPQVPECAQPQGIERDLCLVFWRQGTLPVPTNRDGLVQPRLIAFVDEMQRITRPGAHRPTELHLLTWGISGLSTDIHAFGSRQPIPGGAAGVVPAGVAPAGPPAPAGGPLAVQGAFVPIPGAQVVGPLIPVPAQNLNAAQAPPTSTGDGLIGLLLDADRQNNDHHFEDTTYLVSLVEAHVVDGTSAASLAGIGIIAPHFHPTRNKYILKNKLVALRDRDSVCTNAGHRGIAPPVTVSSPREDMHLLALLHAKMWRGHQLTRFTAPTHAEGVRRCQNRNNQWQ